MIVRSFLPVYPHRRHGPGLAARRLQRTAPHRCRRLQQHNSPRPATRGRVGVGGHRRCDIVGRAVHRGSRRAPPRSSEQVPSSTTIIRESSTSARWGQAQPSARISPACTVTPPMSSIETGSPTCNASEMPSLPARSFANSEGRTGSTGTGDRTPRTSYGEPRMRILSLATAEARVVIRRRPASARPGRWRRRGRHRIRDA